MSANRSVGVIAKTVIGAERDSTSRLTRRALLASLGASAALAWPALTPPARAKSSDALQDWIRSNAIAVRTVDAADEDFSDLEPLGDLIGTARVVQLGEPSHGAGTSFAAKVRLVKYLHARRGFDVLAWESGFYDLTRVEADLRAGHDAVASAQRGILKIWSASEQCRPLFEYAKSSHAGHRPLVMAGFDMQFSSNAFVDMAVELRSFVGATRKRKVRFAATQSANDALDAFEGFDAFVQARAARAAVLPPPPPRDALDRLQLAVGRLTDLFDEHPAAFGDRRQLGFMARAITSMAGFGANLYERYGAESPGDDATELVRSNRRDNINAQNLRWLIEKGYPGRKIIVWAHNAHVMNAYYLSDWKNISLDAVGNAMKPSGVYLADWLGNDLYTIGCTTYEGQDGWVGSKPAPVPSARDGGIEARLHDLGMPYALLDFRAARLIAGHPLRRPQVMRVPKYDEIEIVDPTRPYDAIFYAARMEPAKLIT